MLLKNIENIVFDEYVIDRAKWVLRWRDEPIAVSRKTFDLLLYLIDHRDQVAAKDELLSALWPKQVVEESNLTQQIFLLRKALSRHASAAKIIETVAGRGYRFVAKVEEAPITGQNSTATTVVLEEHRSITRVSIDEETEEAEVVALKPLFTLQRAAIGAALLALCAAAAFGWHFWENRMTGQPVAVVLAEFEDASGDAALGRALDAAIRIDLNQSPFVTVLSPGKVRGILTAMRQPKDVVLTPVLAREVCERNAAQVVLQGSVSKFGSHYLLSLRATSCLSGDLVAEDKREVKHEDDLPAAMDALSASVRRRLGESRASIKRFEKPLSAMNTESLGALKAYTTGRRLSDQGDYVGALPLLLKAVELDPNFGDAYIDVAACYFNTGDADRAAQAIAQAYQLRDTMGENNRQYSTALYHQMVDQDLEAGLEAYKTFAALVGNVSSFGNLANAYDDLGQAQLGIEPAQRALALDPNQQSVYVILGAAQLHGGQPAQAVHTGERAIAKGFDDDTIRDMTLLADYANHDAVGVEAQLTWAHAHPGSVAVDGDEILLALTKGENRRARVLLAHFIKAERPAEMRTLAENNLAAISRALADEGLIGESAAILKSLSPAAVNEDVLVAMAEAGMTAQASGLLHQALAAHPHGTLWKHVREPQVDAALLLGEHKPLQALAALEPAVGWEGVSFGATYLRGRAYADLGSFDKAAIEFKKITDRLWTDPTSNLYQLSYLQMARAQLQMKDAAAAKASYAQFLDLWKTADADAPPLMAAKSELKQML